MLYGHIRASSTAPPSSSVSITSPPTKEPSSSSQWSKIPGAGHTELRGLLIQHAPELVAKVIEMAKDGDATALRICMDRLLPPTKAKDDPVSLPTLTDSLADNSRAVIK